MDDRLNGICRMTAITAAQQKLLEAMWLIDCGDVEFKSDSDKEALMIQLGEMWRHIQENMYHPDQQRLNGLLDRGKPD